MRDTPAVLLIFAAAFFSGCFGLAIKWVVNRWRERRERRRWLAEIRASDARIAEAQAVEAVIAKMEVIEEARHPWDSIPYDLRRVIHPDPVQEDNSNKWN